jgi:hypothetical protein
LEFGHFHSQCLPAPLVVSAHGLIIHVGKLHQPSEVVPLDHHHQGLLFIGRGGWWRVGLDEIGDGDVSGGVAVGGIGIGLALTQVDILLANLLVGLQSYLRTGRDPLPFCVGKDIQRVCWKVARVWVSGRRKSMLARKAERAVGLPSII